MWSLPMPCIFGHQPLTPSYRVRHGCERSARSANRPARFLLSSASASPQLSAKGGGTRSFMSMCCHSIEGERRMKTRKDLTIRVQPGFFLAAMVGLDTFLAISRATFCRTLLACLIEGEHDEEDVVCSGRGGFGGPVERVRRGGPSLGVCLHQLPGDSRIDRRSHRCRCRGCRRCLCHGHVRGPGRSLLLWP